jgi:hypothetical protein
MHHGITLQDSLRNRREKLASDETDRCWSGYGERAYAAMSIAIGNLKGVQIHVS